MKYIVSIGALNEFEFNDDQRNTAINFAELAAYNQKSDRTVTITLEPELDEGMKVNDQDEYLEDEDYEEVGQAFSYD